RACSDSPPRNSWTTWRLNSIECVRCLAMGFLLESPVQLADSHLPHLSTPRGALHIAYQSRLPPASRQNRLAVLAVCATRSGGLSCTLLFHQLANPPRLLQTDDIR